MNRSKIIFIFGIIIVFCLTGFVFSAETSGSGDEHHEQTLFQTISQWLNTLILVALLYFFFTRTIKIQDRFKGNYEQIQSSIESARKAKEEAEMKLKELDQKMAQLNDEVAKIKSDAAKEAEETKKRILESAQKEAERIVEQAHREIDSEVEIARKELRKQIADEAVSGGREIITRELNEEDSKRLINDYIEGFRK